RTDRTHRPRPRADLYDHRAPCRWARGAGTRGGHETQHRTGRSPGIAGPAGGTRRTHTPTRAGFVALIGEPNAGKSTLLNRMVGAKVSIVTHKVQTTRARIRGVCMAGQSQIVFVDTPGIFRPRRRLDRSMVKAAWGGAADADIVVLLVEAHRGLTEGTQAIIDRLRDEMPRGKPVALAINKIDRVKAEVLLGLAEKLNEAFPFAKTFMISAERGYGVEDLKDWLAAE